MCERERERECVYVRVCGCFWLLFLWGWVGGCGVFFCLFTLGGVLFWGCRCYFVVVVTVVVVVAWLCCCFCGSNM